MSMENNAGNKSVTDSVMNWIKKNPVFTAVTCAVVAAVLICIVAMSGKKNEKTLPAESVSQPALQTAESVPAPAPLPTPDPAAPKDDEEALPEVHVVYLPESVQLKLVRINAKSNVAIADEYYIGAFEVTQNQYKAVMNENPSKFQGGTLPVENVAWDKVMMFCDKLTAGGHALAGWKFSLPTSEQWEFACRAGTRTAFSCGNELTVKDANFSRSKILKPVIVGSFPANAYGLYDMHGNVWEWCSNTVPPKKGTTGKMREIRGGSWGHPERSCRSATRGRASQFMESNTIGFRVVMVKAD